MNSLTYNRKPGGKSLKNSVPTKQSAEIEITVDLFLAGTGAVGSTVLQQLKSVEPKGIKFRLLGICNSRNVLWDDGGLNFLSELNWAGAEQTDWKTLIKQLIKNYRHNLIFVDATGSKEVAKLYPKLFEAGIHIVTPSKLANTLDQSFYNLLRETANSTRVKFRYETTVGAGLPLLSTINDLKRSGDTITEISGVISGTMTYLFDRLENGTPFSEAIIEAREKGYAEPDPRDDLSGEDVARKFLILAREIGWNLERKELKVQSLIPEELALVDAQTFLEQLPEFDDSWIYKQERAQKNGATLRYIGRLKDDQVTIGVEEVSRKSPLGQINGTDNFIRIYSKRYHKSPITIQGPGAGKEVTAAGILSDIIAVTDTTL